MLIVAAALLVVIGIVHSYLGERSILIRLFRREDLPKLLGSDWFTKRTIRFAWHLTSIAWWGYAALLIAPDSALAITAAVFLLHGLVTFAASNGKHLAWIAFLAIAALVWMA